MTRLLAQGGPDGVAVVLVGDELLLGSVADTNGAWLARAVTSSGLRLVAMEVVPDDVDRVAEAVGRLAPWVGNLVLSGGIGPTSDDVTRQALAVAASSHLVRDAASTAAIEARYRARGRSAGKAALRMAERPEQAQMITNAHGSAPGVRLELGDAVVYAVPGVPGELRPMVRRAVLPDIVARVGPVIPIRSASLEVAVLGESDVAALLREVEAEVDCDPIADLAYLARPAHVSVRVSVRSPDDALATVRLDHYVRSVSAALGLHVMGRDGSTLPAAVVSLLVEQEATVAAAESLTGGGVVQALTDVPGASAAVLGGVTAYATDIKSRLLGVPTDLLAEHGPVHPKVATAMAVGVRDRLGSTWGVSTTGAAGPEPVGRHPPGEVHICVAGPTTQTLSLTLPTGRDRVRALAVAHALDLLRRSLLGGESGSHANR